MKAGPGFRALDALWALAVAGLGGALALVLRRSRRQLQAEQRCSERAQAETFEAGRMRDHVLASASHDLKTPLASIKLLVHLLKRDAAKGPVPPEHLLARLAMIEANLNKVSSLISELLDVARLQGGKPVQLHLADTDLVRLASKVADSFQPAMGKHRIVVDTQLSALVGCWDGDRLERVLQNLVSNGIRYSPEGGDIVVKLDRQRIRSSDTALVSVSDTGLGILPEDRPHVFEWFRRGRNVEHIAGTGVGLASAKQIVEKHGGTIEVSSNPGGGTTFTVRLPMRAEAERESPSRGAVGLPDADRE